MFDSVALAFVFLRGKLAFATYLLAAQIELNYYKFADIMSDEKSDEIQDKIMNRWTHMELELKCLINEFILEWLELTSVDRSASGITRSIVDKWQRRMTRVVLDALSIMTHDLMEWMEINKLVEMPEDDDIL